MEVIAPCAAPLSPHSPPRCKRTSLSYCPWRMHDVDDRRGGDVTTAFGTCKLVDSKGPHEFRAFAERFWRLYGRDASPRSVESAIIHLDHPRRRRPRDVRKADRREV